MILRFFKTIIIIIFYQIAYLQILKYFQEGLNLYNNKKFDEAKFKFEQDIVFNPKSEMSYLYLSKIFKNLEKKFRGTKFKYCYFT